MQHVGDCRRWHLTAGMLPARVPVLVDDRGAYPFQKVALRHRAVGEPVFEIQRRRHRRPRIAQAADDLDAAGRGQGRDAGDFLERILCKFAVISLQTAQNRTQVFACKEPVNRVDLVA